MVLRAGFGVLIASFPDICMLFALCIISSNIFIMIFLFINVYNCTNTEVEGEVGIPFKRLSTQVIFYITDLISYIIDRSKAVLRIRFYVLACFGVSFCTLFTFCVPR